MMKAADLRNGNDRAISSGFDCWWGSRVLIERLMGPGIMIVAEIFLQYSAKMLFRKYNHVVKTFAADTADHLFRVCVLPGRVRGGDYFFDLYSIYSPPEIVSVDRISISDQVSWGSFFRKRLDQLLSHPGGGRMFRDVEMNDLTSLMQKNDEAVKVSEGHGGDSKKIDADDVAGMIGEESLPRLGGRLGRLYAVFCDSGFSHLEAEWMEFGFYTRCAPQRILS
jgi:hypothetical protein